MKILILWAIVALLTSACGSTGTKLTDAQRCVEGGGIWRPAIEFCEPASGGGGGY